MSPRLRSAIVSLAPSIVFGTGLFAAWEAWVRVRNVKDYILPPPSAVATAFYRDPARYLDAVGASLLTAISGLVLATVLAFALAVLMAHSRVLERALYPTALLVKVTPIIAVYPLLLIWFGFGVWPRIVVAALITFFPTLVNAVVGLRSIDPASMDFMRVMDATRAQVFWKLRVPSSLPYVFAALRISVPLSLIGAVVAEFLGGTGGMGQLILIANNEFETDVLFAAVFTLAAVGIAMTAVVASIEARVLRWSRTQYWV